jgi:hypothetical protein
LVGSGQFAVGNGQLAKGSWQRAVGNKTIEQLINLTIKQFKP